MSKPLFHITFHHPNSKLPYPLVRLKELLRVYIDTVNGGKHQMNPGDMEEFESYCRKLTSQETSKPLIYYESRIIKGIDGNEKTMLCIMWKASMIPFAMISEEY